MTWFFDLRSSSMDEILGSLSFPSHRQPFAKLYYCSEAREKENRMDGKSKLNFQLHSRFSKIEAQHPHRHKFHCPPHGGLAISFASVETDISALHFQLAESTGPFACGCFW